MQIAVFSRTALQQMQQPVTKARRGKQEPARDMEELPSSMALSDRFGWLSFTKLLRNPLGMGGNRKLSVYYFALCIWSKPREFGSLEPKREYGPISDPYYAQTEISITHATNPTGSHPLTMHVLILWVISAK